MYYAVLRRANVAVVRSEWLEGQAMKTFLGYIRFNYTPRSRKGPAVPPHPTRSTPTDSPATGHEGLAVAANLAQEGRACRSWP